MLKKFLLPAMIVYLAVLIAGTVYPFPVANQVLTDNYTMSIRWDYLIHFFMYMPMPVLFFLVGYERNRKEQWLPVILVSSLLASGFELSQVLLPYRKFNINDLLGNLVGVLLGVILLLTLRKSFMRILSLA